MTKHWIHLRTTNPIESTLATVRLRQRVTKGPGSRAAGVAMAFKLIESAQTRWRAVNAPPGRNWNHIGTTAPRPENDEGHPVGWPSRSRTCVPRPLQAGLSLVPDSGGGIRTRDLRVMSPTSYLTAPPRVVDL